MHAKNGYRITVVIGIIVLTLLTVTVIVALEVSHVGPRSTPAIASILGFTAPTIAALFALLGVERVKYTQDGINQKMDVTQKKATEAHDAITKSTPLLEDIAQRVRDGKL